MSIRRKHLVAVAVGVLVIAAVWAITTDLSSTRRELLSRLVSADRAIVSAEGCLQGIPPFEIRDGQLSELITAIGHAGDRTGELPPPSAAMCYIYFHRGDDCLLTLVYCEDGIFIYKTNPKVHWFWNTSREMENLIDRRILGPRSALSGSATHPTSGGEHTPGYRAQPPDRSGRGDAE